MIYFDNQSNLKINRIDFERLCLHQCNQDIEVLIVEDEDMAKLNQTYRGKEGITDVLSFPYECDLPHIPLGSIVMSATLIKQKSQEFGHSLEEEVSLLFIHAFLHLLGYDHEVDNGEHRAKEEEMIRLLNLPKSLIIRSC